MKRLLACVSFVAAATTAAPAAAPTAKPTAKPLVAHHKAPPIRVAPADEYFGKLKMSVLGIRNTIKDVGANLDIDQARWTQLASKAAFAEDAIRDWERKYPQDTWLSKTVFALERMYAKLDSDEGRKRAIASMRWLVHDFPKSWYGKTGKRELALGKVGRPPETATANASPAPGTAVVPAALSSAAPAAGAAPAMGEVNAASNVSTEQSAGATPVPFPSTSPGTPNNH